MKQHGRNRMIATIAALCSMATCLLATVFTSDMEDLALAPGSHWNGSDLSGGFESDMVHFRNTYDTNYASWCGFACSSVNDTNTVGYSNQYAVWTPGTAVGGTGNYAVVYDSSWDEQDVVTFPFPVCVKGCYVNNTTYAALSMRNGDTYAKKFGGAGGDDPDWFMLNIVGKDKTGAVVGTKEFYLADYRFADNAQDYIVGKWTWIDLAAFGPAVKTLHFSLSSSDTSYGFMNTPAYFAMDNLEFIPKPAILTSDFENPPLSSGSYWNGSDLSGGFESDLVHFSNAYDTNYASWCGFAYSSVNDTNTAGSSNQYAVWTPGTGVGGTGNYAVVYDASWDEQDIVTFHYPVFVEGFYVNNTTYAALSMRNGDAYAKKFGGASGDEPDWFKLTITGKDAKSNVVGTVDFYLADYRSGTNAQDYIISDWTWVDLRSIGPAVKTLHFSLSSSDNSSGFMNTPAYFAMDRLSYVYSFSGPTLDNNPFDSAVPGFMGPDGLGVAPEISGNNFVNPAFCAWAAGCANYAPAPDVAPQWTDTSKTLGPVSGYNMDIASLGDLNADQINSGVSPGEITLAFSVPIADRSGPDFVVFENGFIVDGTVKIFAELGYVEVSSDGNNFVRFPSVSLTTNLVGGYGYINAQNVYNLLGKHANAYGASWGTPFDLSDLACDPLVLNGTVALTNITHVRIVDIPGNGFYKDSLTNGIYDAWVTWGSGGVDLEAIGAINSLQAARIEITVTGPGSVSPCGYVYSENIVPDNTINWPPTASPGYVCPKGLTSVLHGRDQTFTFAPTGSFPVLDVRVDGVSMGAVSSYTFTNVQADHTLEAVFATNSVKTLTVVSEQGGTYPGTQTAEIGTALSQFITNSPVSGGTCTQFVCIAGAVESNDYTLVSPTNVTLTLTNDATLTWQWQTQYRLIAVISGNGNVTPADGWYATGSSTTLTATAAANWYFTGWRGDTNGCDIAGNSITVPMTQARTITAAFSNNQPIVTFQPVSAVVVEGQAVSLSVAYSGTGPFGYQWLKDGAILPGQTNSTLSFASFQFTNSGSYYAVITNSYGMAISMPASLSVSNAPLRAWGYNYDGQFGNGTTGKTNRPTAVANNAVVAAVGNAHSLYVTADGTLWAAGALNNNFGQLGNGTTIGTNRFIAVASNVMAAAAGYNHSLYVTADGTLWTMGYNLKGQLGNGNTTQQNSPVAVASNVVAVAAGSHHSLYITTDGILWAMGYNNYGQLGNGTTTDTNRPVVVASNVVTVAAGQEHSLYVTADGTLWVMGDNTYGQLGNGTTVSTNRPIAVTNNVMAMAAGSYHSLYVTADGTLWAVGGNNYGQLGIGATADTNWPVAVDSNVVAVAAGRFNSLYVTADGTLWAMGDNGYGQLGDGTTTDTNLPVRICGVMPASLAKGPGADCSMAIAEAAPVVTLVPNWFVDLGQSISITASAFGNGGPFTYQWLFNGTNIPDATNAACTIASAALSDAGCYSVIVSSIYGSTTSADAILRVNPIPIITQPVSAVVEVGQAAGLNVIHGGTGPFGYQWLKDGVILPGQTNSTLSFTSFQFIDSGSYSVVITNAYGMGISLSASLSIPNAPLRAWGQNNFGQLGNGATVNTNRPILVASNVVAMTAGLCHSLYITAGGALWSMGYNASGQLGNGTTTDTNRPIVVASDVVSASAGQYHSLYVTADGTLWAVGYNNRGQLGNGTTINTNLPIAVASNVVSVAAGYYHSLYVTTDGTLWAMGYNKYGELGNGNTTQQNSPIAVASNVVSVSAGQYYSLYVKADGTLWAMGYNNHGQLGNGTTVNTNRPFLVTNNVIDVAAGYYHSLYVTADGTLWAMGYNNHGQLGNGNTTQQNRPIAVANNVAAVAAGYYHSLYVTADGTPWAMGHDGYGQLGDGSMFDALLPIRLNGGGILAASLAKGCVPNHSLSIAAASPVLNALTNQTVNLGQPAGFTASISAGDGPFTYQWQLNGTNIPNATNAVYAIANVTLANAGNYTVIVTGIGGSATTGATLNVTATLAIQSGHGTANPAVGIYTNNIGSILTNTTASPDRQGTVQYVCSGWSMIGNDPANGTTTQCVMTVTNNSVLTWLWTTNYWLTADVLGNGTVMPADGWYATGSNATLTATAAAGWYFTRWSGDTNGCAIAGNSITAPMTQARAITANFAMNRPVVTVQPASAVLELGQAVSLSVAYSGVGPFGYQWLKDGAILPGQTNSTLSFTSFQFTNSGCYCVVITNSYGMTISLPASLSEPNAPLRTWGYNNYGQLGNGTTTDTNRPVVITNNVVASAVGQAHSLYVMTDGALWGMGQNSYGQLGNGTTNNASIPVYLASNVAAAAAGYRHSLYITGDGILWAMGRNDRGQLGIGTTTDANSPVVVASNVVAVAAGYEHSLYVTADGVLWAMGRNQYGELGNGNKTQQKSPVAVASNVVAVTAGQRHSLFLAADCTLQAMGWNIYGQLGNGTTVDTNRPFVVTNNVMAVAAGYYHSLYVTADGTLWAMGKNNSGQLGNGTTVTPQTSPIAVASNVVAAAAEYRASLFITADGTLWAMGGNEYGDLGNGSTIDTSLPVRVNNGGLQVAGLAKGSLSYHSLAIAESAPVVSILSYQLVDLGQPAGFTASISSGVGPFTYQWQFNGTNIPNATNAAYAIESAALNDAGCYSVIVYSIYGSGNASGTLRVNPIPITAQPVSAVVGVGQAAGLSVAHGGAGPFGYQWLKDGVILPGQTNSALSFSSFQFTNSGNYCVVISNACGLTISLPASLSVPNAPLRAWGRNDCGQLGNGTTDNSSLPIHVADNAVAASAGTDHSLYITADGGLWTMGANYYGQLGDGTTTQHNSPVLVTNNVAAVAAGYYHSLYITADGTLWAMGWNLYGQLGNGATTDAHLPVVVANKVVAAAAGYFHSLYITADGTLWAMGANSYGQLGNSNTALQNLPVAVASNVVSIFAGAEHSQYITADGVLWTMGRNNYGQLGNGATTDSYLPAVVASNAVIAAAGNEHSLYVTADDTLWAMGRNNRGQLGDGTTTQQNSPIAVASNVVEVDVGGYHSLYVTTDGVLWAMGRNNHGQLGNGTTTDTNRPVRVNGGGLLTASLARRSGAFHSLAIAAVTPAVNALTNQTVILGQPAGFTASVSAGDGPFTYQWQLNGTNIPNATNAVYTIAGAALTDAGNYTVIVTGIGGSATAGATLNVTATLAIQSDHGIGNPAVGMYTNEPGSILTNTVAGSDQQGTTQYVCSGWSMTGNDPVSGTTTQCVMTVTNNAVLTWLWETNYWLTTATSGSGTVTAADGWYAAGGSATLTATAATNWHFAGWSGDTNGCTAAGNLITAVMKQARAITANFTPTPPVINGWLAIQVTPTNGTWQLTAPAGYSGPTAGMGNLAAVSAVTGAYRIAYGDLPGYTAPSSQVQFVTGGSTTLFTGVYLQIATNAETADLAVRDLVFLPVNVTNLSPAGTVSCRIHNYGPSALTAVAVHFDFYMASNASQVAALNGNAVWIGGFQRTVNLPANDEALIILTAAERQGVTIHGNLRGTYQPKVTVRYLTPINDPILTNNTALGVGLVTVKTNGPNSMGRSFRDYDGDGKSDLAVFRNGYWSIFLVGENSVLEGGFGNPDGIPLSGDFNGDGKSDLAVFRNGYWSIFLVGENSVLEGGFGNPDGIPLSGDFNGDGKSDLAVFRNGYWSIFLVGENSVLEGGWGSQGWSPVSRDYDGDGKSDVAVYRDGYWSIYLMAGSVLEGGWGSQGWIPVSGDYDGDGKSDLAVYRDGYWSIYLMAGRVFCENTGFFGGPGWTPVQ